MYFLCEKNIFKSRIRRKYTTKCISYARKIFFKSRTRRRYKTKLMKILKCVDVIFTRKVIKTSLSIEARWQPFSNITLHNFNILYLFWIIRNHVPSFCSQDFSALEGISNLYSLKFRLLSDTVPGSFCLQWFSHISVLHFFTQTVS